MLQISMPIALAANVRQKSISDQWTGRTVGNQQKNASAPNVDPSSGRHYGDIYRDGNGLTQTDHCARD
jgi:hypothetical protein